MSSMQHFRLHRLPLPPLRKKYGNLSEMKIATLLVKDINFTQLRPFEFVSNGLKTKGNLANIDKEKLFGFESHVYCQLKKVADEFMKDYKVQRFKTTYNYIVFYSKPGYLFAVTFGEYWTILQRASCTKFPVELTQLTICEGSDNWRPVPLTEPIYNLKALYKAPLSEIRMMVTEYFIHFRFEDDLNLCHVPELIEFFIKASKTEFDEPMQPQFVCNGGTT